MTKKKSVRKKSVSPKAAAKPAGKSKAPAVGGVVNTGFWLMKSEPESYSIEDFERDGKTLWTGVRNYLARNFMTDVMKPGDQFLFYHSNAEPSAAAGIGEVLRVNQPDPTALDPSSDYHDPKSSTDHPIWFCAEVGFKKRFKKPVTLQDIRDCKDLAGMPLLQKGQRLSILSVNAKDFALVMKMGGI